MGFYSMSRKQSGLVILIVYLFTMFLGVIFFLVGSALMIPQIFLILFVDVVMTCIIFIAGLIIKNASLYDPYWSVIPPYLLILYALVYSNLRAASIIMILAVVLIWSVRLTYNWWKNWASFATQDWRYNLLREKNEKLYPLTNLFGIHLIPTIVVFFQLVVITKLFHSSTINIGFYIGLFISLLGPIIQFIADRQMYKFRSDKAVKGKVINSGLWRFSRHPNYFGEVIFWIGFYVIYISVYKQFDLYFLFPLSMVLLFVFISVPMMEKKLIDRPGYPEYKSRVSMLIPFFPKRVK